MEGWFKYFRFKDNLIHGYLLAIDLGNLLEHFSSLIVSLLRNQILGGFRNEEKCD
jgi:hypothetical protein